MKRSDEEIVAGAFGRLIGSVSYYFILRRMGAPRYVAYIATGVNSHLYEIANPSDKDEIVQATNRLMEKYFKSRGGKTPFTAKLSYTQAEIDEGINRLLEDQ